MWRCQFEESPRFETYQDLRRLATQTGVWDHLRSTLLGNLDTQRYATFMIDVALDEGNVERALEILSQPGALVRAETQMRVAQAAEADHPRAALEIYRSRAERAIAARGRGNYVTAAELLLRVRDLYGQLGAESTWQGDITRIVVGPSLHLLDEQLDLGSRFGLPPGQGLQLADAPRFGLLGPPPLLPLAPLLGLMQELAHGARRAQWGPRRKRDLTQAPAQLD